MIYQQKTNDQDFSRPKSFLNRPAVQHVKVKYENFIEFILELSSLIKDNLHNERN